MPNMEMFDVDSQEIISPEINYQIKEEPANIRKQHDALLRNITFGKKNKDILEITEEQKPNKARDQAKARL